MAGRIRSMIKVEHCCNENGMHEMQQFLTDNIVVIKFILQQGISEILIAANISLCSLHFKWSVHRIKFLIQMRYFRECFMNLNFVQISFVVFTS